MKNCFCLNLYRDVCIYIEMLFYIEREIEIEGKTEMTSRELDENSTFLNWFKSSVYF